MSPKASFQSASPPLQSLALSDLTETLLRAYLPRSQKDIFKQISSCHSPSQPSLAFNCSKVQMTLKTLGVPTGLRVYVAQ